MSSHFEFVVNCYLDEALSNAHLEFLQAICARKKPQTIPEALLDQDEPWTALDVTDGWTFPGEIYARFGSKVVWYVDGKPVTKHYLSMRCHVHDDALGMALEFVDWLASIAEKDACFIGYYREEFSANPTLLYFSNGQLKLHEVEDSPIR